MFNIVGFRLCRSAAPGQRRKTRVDFIHRGSWPLDTSAKECPQLQVRPDEESQSGGLANFKWSSLRSDPETVTDRTPRESLLACMTANHEPSNQSFAI